MTLAGGRDVEDSGEGCGEKEHPCLGNQASLTMLFKEQRDSSRKKPRVHLHAYFPKAE